MLFTPVHLHFNSLPYVKMYEDLNSAPLRPQMKQFEHIIIKPAVVFACQHHPAFADEHLFKRALLKDSDVIQKDHLLYQSLHGWHVRSISWTFHLFSSVEEPAEKTYHDQKSQKISNTSEKRHPRFRKGAKTSKTPQITNITPNKQQVSNKYLPNQGIRTNDLIRSGSGFVGRRFSDDSLGGLVPGAEFPAILVGGVTPGEAGVGRIGKMPGGLRTSHHDNYDS